MKQDCRAGRQWDHHFLHRHMPSLAPEPVDAFFDREMLRSSRCSPFLSECIQSYGRVIVRLSISLFLRKNAYGKGRCKGCTRTPWIGYCCGAPPPSKTVWTMPATNCSSETGKGSCPWKYWM